MLRTHRPRPVAMRRQVLAVVAVSMTALAMAACATPADSANGTSPAADEPAETLRELTIAVLPVAPYAPVYIADSMGFFEEEGLSVTIELQQNAAQIVPAILNGSVDIGTGSVPPLVAAVDNGLPIRGIAGLNAIQTAEKETARLLVMPDSGISSLADLPGKTVGVNALNGLLHLGIVAAMRDAGLDDASVEFVAIGFPEMGTSLRSGNLDATLVTEPFATDALDQGAVDIGGPLSALGVGAPAAVVFATEQLASSDPGLVESVRAAIAKAADYANSHPEAVGEALEAQGGITAEQFASLRFTEHYDADYDPATIDKIAGLMFDLGWVNGEHTVDDLMIE